MFGRRESVKNIDAVIIGASPAAIVAAGYIARSGAGVCVVDRAPPPGETVARTAEASADAPGDAAYPSARVLNPISADVWRDFNLYEEGVRAEATPAVSTLLPGKRAISVFADAEQTAASFGAFNSIDGGVFQDAVQAFQAASETGAALAAQLAAQGGKSRKGAGAEPSPRQATPEAAAQMRLAAMRAADLLEDLFTSEASRAHLAAAAFFESSVGPYAPFSASAVATAWAKARRPLRLTGESADLRAALLRGAERFGAEILHERTVEDVQTTDGRVRSVRLDDGAVVKTRAVLAAGVRGAAAFDNLASDYSVAARPFHPLLPLDAIDYAIDCEFGEPLDLRAAGLAPEAERGLIYIADSLEHIERVQSGLTNGAPLLELQCLDDLGGGATRALRVRYRWRVDPRYPEKRSPARELLGAIDERLSERLPEFKSKLKRVRGPFVLTAAAFAPQDAARPGAPIAQNFVKGAPKPLEGLYACADNYGERWTGETGAAAARRILKDVLRK